MACVSVVWYLKSWLIYLYYLDISQFEGYLYLGVVSGALYLVINTFIESLDFNHLKMMASGSGSGGGANPPTGGANTAGGANPQAGGANPPVQGVDPNINYPYPQYNPLGNTNQPHMRILADT